MIALREVLIKGERFLLTPGDSVVRDASDFEQFRPSYAQYYPDAGVMRYRKKIAEPHEVVFTGNTVATTGPTNPFIAIAGMFDWLDEAEREL